jgi:hypothetical protein
LHVSVREGLRSGHLHVWWRSCIAVPRLPMDARTAPAFPDALYPLHGGPVWAFCPCSSFCAACSAYCVSSCGARRCRRSRWNSDPAERGRRSGPSAISPFRETCLPAYSSFRSRCIPRASPVVVPRLLDGRRTKESVYVRGGRLSSRFTSRFIAIASIFSWTISTRARYLHAPPA